MYVIADDGERNHGPYPGEMGRAREVVGEDTSQEEIDCRTEFNTNCFCTRCETQVNLESCADVYAALRTHLETNSLIKHILLYRSDYT